MGKIIKLSMLCWLAAFQIVWGQGNVLSGKVVENSTQLPLEFVQVALFQNSDSTLVKSVLSNAAGDFILPEIPPGSYYLTLSFIGFENFSSPVFLANRDTNLGRFSIFPAAILLNAAEVTAEQSAFVQVVDRKIYYPEKDIAATAGSASEILQNIPSVSVNIDGVVSLRGSSNITFLINGKPSGLMNRSSATFLQQMPANSIERIEIITNPSAKYRPDGTAGIINIVLKKNIKPGFNGALTANASTRDRYNGSLSMSYKPGKLNLFGSYGFRQSWYPREGTDLRIDTDTSTGERTQFELRSTAVGRPRSHSVNGGLEYQFDSKNKLEWTGAYFTFLQDRTHHISTLQRNATDIIQDYTTARREHETEREFETSASYEHQFESEDHTIQLEIGYTSYAELEDNRYDDTFLTPDFPVLSGHNTIKKSGHTISVLTEYAKAIVEDLELEAGYEGEFFHDDLDYASERFDPIQLLWTPETYKTNRFLFRQDLHALYGTISKEIEDFSVLLGLRAEQALITSQLLTLDSFIPNNYFKLFPTLHFSWQISDAAQLGLSYSRRVNRPDSDELNPFAEYKDPRNFEAGNPDLKPEQIHSLELSFQLKKEQFSILPSLYYRYEYDAFAELSHYINDSTLLTTFDNLASNQSAGLELVIAWDPSTWLKVNLSANSFWNSLDATNLGYAAKKYTVSSEFKLAANFNLWSDTKVQSNVIYRSAFLTAQGAFRPVYSVNAGLRQDLLKNQASLLLTVSDVFNTMRWAWTIDRPELKQEVTRRRRSQIVYLGLVWRFGVSPKRGEREPLMIFDDKL